MIDTGGSGLRSRPSKGDASRSYTSKSSRQSSLGDVSSKFDRKLSVNQNKQAPSKDDGASVKKPCEGRRSAKRHISNGLSRSMPPRQTRVDTNVSVSHDSRHNERACRGFHRQRSSSYEPPISRHRTANVDEQRIQYDPDRLQLRSMSSNDAQDISSPKTTINNYLWTDHRGSSGYYSGEINNQFQPHGQGKFVCAEGTTIETIWANGKPVEGHGANNIDVAHSAFKLEEAESISSVDASFRKHTHNKHHGSKPDPDAVDGKAKTPRMYLPQYSLGDVASEGDMITPSDPAESLRLVVSLKLHDFAFVLRGKGTWTYAIIADFPVKRDEYARMRFVVDTQGRTKTLDLQFWSTHVRLVSMNKVGTTTHGKSTTKYESRLRGSVFERMMTSDCAVVSDDPGAPDESEVKDSEGDDGKMFVLDPGFMMSDPSFNSSDAAIADPSNLEGMLDRMIEQCPGGKPRYNKGSSSFLTLRTQSTNDEKPGIVRL